MKGENGSSALTVRLSPLLVLIFIQTAAPTTQSSFSVTSPPPVFCSNVVPLVSFQTSLLSSSWWPAAATTW